jgi:4-hydroxybenzoyl-CoA reductase subunit beta
MLRLPQLGVATPTDLDAALSLLARPGARLVAGGTDLLPNLKHRLDRPPLLVSLSGIASLRAIDVRDGSLCIGAGVTLTQVAEHERVRAVFPSLAHAAGHVASPLIRNMGTLGGNVNLDTRCRYVNQTEFWRSAIGGCLKSEGTVCHVVPGGRNCVAAMSSDCVPVLISLGATLVLRSPRGTREVLAADYFVADGTRHTVRADDEITTEIRVPVPTVPQRAAYTKWSVRHSIDFPLVSIAVRFDLESDDARAPLMDLRVVVGVLGSRPREVTRLEDLRGRSLADADVRTAIADRVHTQCKPLENVPYEAAYRRDMLRVYVERMTGALVLAG